MDETTAQDLKQKLDSKDDFLLLDVREEEEEQIAKIEGAVRIPLWELEDRVDEIASFREKLIIVHCHLGMRSAQACEVLAEQGFTQVLNLKGGIDAWSDVDPSIARY